MTGGGGFLGRYVVRGLIDEGREVAILGRSPQPDLEEAGVEVIRGDIWDRETVIAACKGKGTAFHVAALAGIWGARDAYFRTNVQGTQNVLDGCREGGVKKLVYTSTPSVAFSGADLSGVDESEPYGKRWLCHYAETKALAEQEVLAADGVGGVRTTALRPHLIWGIGDNHLIPRIIARAQSGRLRIVGDGTNKVDITHVENAAEAHLLAERALDGAGRAAGKAYFISQGEPVVLWDWINNLLHQLNISPVTKRLSPRAAYVAGAVMEGIYGALKLTAEPPMTRFLAVELAKNHYFNIDAARRDLGYRARKSTREGMAELVTRLKEAMR